MKMMTKIIALLGFLGGIACAQAITTSHHQSTSECTDNDPAMPVDLISLDRPADDSVCDIAPGLSARQCQAVRDMLLPEELPAARGNAVADNDDAAALGFQIFFDARFGAPAPDARDGQVRCANCHLPESDFDDGLATSQGILKVTRNSPTILNAAREKWLTWDGHADTLWSQPLFAFENPKEMDFTRLEIAHLLDTAYSQSASYKTMYEEVFGAFTVDVESLPARGAPGMAEFDDLSDSDKEGVNLIAANVGKSLEAYMRKIAGGRSLFDSYLLGQQDALSDSAKRGLIVYVRAGCIDCHSGPTLNDGKFHNLGIHQDPAADPDLGRSSGLELLVGNTQFNAYGTFYDGDTPDNAELAAEVAVVLPGMFKTPSLRNVASLETGMLTSAPFGHDGSFATLEDIVDFHLEGGGRCNTDYPGTVDPILRHVELSASQRADLVEFLKHLDGEYPPWPWNFWPDR